MINLYDIAYSIGLGLSAPVWLTVPRTRRKVMSALRERMGEVPARNLSDSAVMVHAVSVGEINATTALIRRLREMMPDLQFIVSTTTQKGFEQGQRLYGKAPDVTLIRYPLDFSSGVQRVLDRLRPALVVLMELEIWPNFLRHCEQRNIPVIVANARMSTASYRRYRWVKPLVASMFRRVNRICAQNEEHARRFIELGAPPDSVVIAGNMKFDTATIADRIDGDAELAAAVGLFPGPQTIWVCGSTGPGEEPIILRVYRQLLGRFNRLRLVIVPRKPERFDEVAELIEAMRFHSVRRSSGQPPVADGGMVPPVVLGDTMGELRKFYSIADVVFVGRSLVDLGSKQHGSDMIEPAALAKPVVVGPWTGNFKDVMRKLHQAQGVLIAEDESQLQESIALLLNSPGQAMAIGQRAQTVVQREQGATERHVQIILELLQNTQKRWPAIVK
jgi:3-deoxy-D-manno-octulosonic-acid transferase